MGIQKVKSFTVQVPQFEGGEGVEKKSCTGVVKIKVYPRFVGWVLSKFKAASVHRHERGTYYLSKEARESLYKQMKSLYQLDQLALPDQCPEKIMGQIFEEAVFGDFKSMRPESNREKRAEPIVNDLALEAMNRVSDVPVVRKNDLLWIRENVKPGSILTVNVHETYAFSPGLVIAGQRFARTKDVNHYHTRALHTMICVAPGKFIEATPSPKGDQVRILDFNQQSLNLPFGSNSEYQVYEPRYDEMSAEKREVWEKRFKEMLHIANNYGVTNTTELTQEQVLALHIFEHVLPENVIPSKLKYAPKDALLSVLKRNHFGKAAKKRIFNEVLTRQTGLTDPLTAKGKRSFICSALTTWLLQGMQHEEIKDKILAKLKEQGKELELPVMIPYPEKIKNPGKFVRTPGHNKEQVRVALQQYRNQVKAYKEYEKQCEKLDKLNGRAISKWAKSMVKEHGEILDDVVECKLNARFTNPMMVQHWIHSRPDVFKMSARIIPELRATEAIQIKV